MTNKVVAFISPSVPWGMPLEREESVEHASYSLHVALSGMFDLIEKAGTVDELLRIHDAMARISMEVIDAQCAAMNKAERL